ncbi:hypothetical protein [Mesorhizobium sp. CN2-181]|uniref:hypothetical protein n=1 Tax=Mesorhizobium yinganensis TaxID=3157707 RepID=UPI0032B7D9B5
MFAAAIIGHTRLMPLASLFRCLMPQRRIGGVFLAALLLSVVTSPGKAEDGEAGEWTAGAYSFSDEMGGFIIESVSGKGTHGDPVVLTETLNSSSPVTLVIRSVWPIRPFDSAALYDNGVLYMRIVARNGSGQGWVEFEFELQELLHKASVFGDGLSFDQRSLRKDNISSDTFAEFSRDFEPYDKLLFRHGKVDPGKSAGFSFLITDFTPRPKFYLVQDPRIPSS